MTAKVKKGDMVYFRVGSQIVRGEVLALGRFRYLVKYFVNDEGERYAASECEVLGMTREQFIQEAREFLEAWTEDEYVESHYEDAAEVFLHLALKLARSAVPENKEARSLPFGSHRSPDFIEGYLAGKRNTINVTKVNLKRMKQND